MSVGQEPAYCHRTCTRNVSTPRNTVPNSFASCIHLPELINRNQIYVLSVNFSAMQDACVLSEDQRSLILCTAESVARNGQGFLDWLIVRRADDTQYGFLQAGHVANSYFVSCLSKLRCSDENVRPSVDEHFSGSRRPAEESPARRSREVDDIRHVSRSRSRSRDRSPRRQYDESPRYRRYEPGRGRGRADASRRCEVESYRSDRHGQRRWEESRDSDGRSRNRQYRECDYKNISGDSQRTSYRLEERAGWREEVEARKAEAARVIGSLKSRVLEKCQNLKENVKPSESRVSVADPAQSEPRPFDGAQLCVSESSGSCLESDGVSKAGANSPVTETNTLVNGAKAVVNGAKALASLKARLLGVSGGSSPS